MTSGLRKQLAGLGVLFLLSLSTFIAVFVDQRNTLLWTAASLCFHCALFIGGYVTAQRYKREVRMANRLEGFQPPHVP